MPNRKSKKVNEDQFVMDVLRIAQQQGFKVEFSNRVGQQQIDFGNKKLHANHLRQLFPAALGPDQNISYAIESVAPGRPCTHSPMRKIIQQLQDELSK